ncbi:hypothetical protein QF021_003673 [Acidovorax delafieldii]|uniref:hypothetical protein n=1 Tax=Acidovorax delafieldii TaxID=47920 RepID=UPI0028621B3C|nr:hypothetical protein [Acidovorax delafieldii]MDR6155584.1 hypothetical protein [Acidovorax delafieldii]
MRSIRFFLSSLAIALSVGAAFAHGVPKPKHGGTVDVGGEISFEMVVDKSTTKFFVEDHGKPVSTKGAVGEVLLGSETGKKIGTLVEAGANSLIGKLAQFKSGNHLFVRVVLSDGSIVVGELIAP